jgi:hypothetical protein
MMIPPPPEKPDLLCLPEVFRQTEYLLRPRFLNPVNARISTPDGQCKFECRPRAWSVTEAHEILTPHDIPLVSITAPLKIVLRYEFTIGNATDDTVLGVIRRPAFRPGQHTLWEIFSAEGTLITRVQEQDAGLAIARRLVGNWVPQTYLFQSEDGQELARCVRTFWAFHLTLYHDWRGIVLDPRLALAGALLITR